MMKRRTFLTTTAASAFGATLQPGLTLAVSSDRITKRIPKTGERIGIIGMGSVRYL